MLPVLALLNADVGSARMIEYEGTVDLDTAATVSLRVKQKHGVHKLAVFEVNDFTIYCEDQSKQVVTLPTERVKFRRPRVFHTEIYSVEPDGTEIFYEIRGRILEHGRARGTFTYRHDPVNPPGSEAPPDCGSARPEIWKAAPIR